MHLKKNPRTGREATVAQTPYDIGHDFAGALALLQRQSAEHVNRKEQHGEVGAEPRRKEGRIERFDRGGFRDVDRKAGRVVLQLGHDGRFLVVTGAPQIEQFEAVRGAHPGGRHQKRDANTKVQLHEMMELMMQCRWENQSIFY